MSPERLARHGDADGSASPPSACRGEGDGAGAAFPGTGPDGRVDVGGADRPADGGGGDGRGASGSQGASRRGEPAAPGHEVLHFYVAGFFRRAAAAFVDGLVILPVFLLVSWVGSLAAGVDLPRLSELTPDLLIGLFIEKNGAVIFWTVMFVILVFLYSFLFVAAKGQTLGKRALGIRIVSWYGEPPSPGRALARALAGLLSASLLGLGFIWIGFDQEKRGLHDWIAGTYVVRS